MDETKQVEYRTFSVDELRRVGDDDKSKRIVGHAAVFNKKTRIADFDEKIAPGAFAETIKSGDIRAFWNHNSDIVLGRNTAGTLSLEEDRKGLKVEIDPPDTELVRSHMASIDRGDVTGMSFGFRVIRETWETNKNKPDLRTLEEIELFEVSPVALPAYENTDVAVRAHEEWQKGQEIEPEPERARLPLAPEFTP